MKRAMAVSGALAAGLVGAGALTLGASGDSTLPGSGGQLLQKSGVIGTGSEAWYSLPFTCTLPTGCLPLPNVLPAGALHVGVIAGETTSQAAISLATNSLPRGAKLTDGTLSLPINTSLGALSVSPEKAGFKACLLTTDFTAGEGLTSAPPTSDCSVSNPATYVTGSGAAHFEIDLQPFIDAWNSGTANHGISLEPFTTAKSDHDTWQVAIVSTSAATDATGKILASLHYLAPAATGGAASPGPAISDSAAPSAAPVTTDTSAPVATTDQAAPVAQQQTPVVAPATVPRSTAAGFAGKGYAYPAVWLLPVALLAGAAWLGRLLTKPIPTKR